MDSEFELLNTLPSDQVDKFIERQMSRGSVELNIIELMQNAIYSLSEDDERDYYKNQILNNFSNFTLNWQTGNMSGTSAEVVSRWVGLGFLTDFPIIRDQEGEEFKELTVSPLLDDNYSIHIKIPVRAANPAKVVEYNFLIDEKKLLERKIEINKEKDKWYKILWDRRDTSNEDL